MRSLPMPPAAPSGWFVVAESAALGPGQRLRARLAGRELVAFRTASGVARVLDAHCPHLGAHLGASGTVVGEALRCNFHGFCFDGAGACTATGYGTKPPPSARLVSWPVREQDGFVFAFHDARGHAPTWQLPEVSWDGWLPVKVASLRLRGHPQETTENSVDVGHLGWVHEYFDTKILRPVETDGASLTIGYAMSRRGALYGQEVVRTEFDVSVHGFGYSRVEITVKTLRDQALRLFVLSSPEEEGRICLRLGVSAKLPRRSSDVHPLLAAVPRAVVARIVRAATLRGVVHDVRQDLALWENKVFVSPPALAEGDGPIGVYRHWAKQFYPGAAAATAALTESA